MNNSKKLIVIAGPTASGKSALAIELAKLYHTEIINADSRQVYSELTIGTAKPKQEDMEGIPHHLFGHVSVHEPYNAATYAQEARSLLESLFIKNDTLILCGGTGLYIQALLEGLDPLPQADPELRLELEERLNQKGLSNLVQELQGLDEMRAQKTDLKNPQRVIRALEIARQLKSSGVNPLENEGAPDLPWETRGYYLNPNREELYSQINKRVDGMMDKGLEAEAKSLFPMRHLKALQTVGYSELFKYFEGEWTKDEAIEKIKQHTRNYAKRQLTWFRNKTDFQPILGLKSILS